MSTRTVTSCPHTCPMTTDTNCISTFSASLCYTCSLTPAVVVTTCASSGTPSASSSVPSPPPGSEYPPRCPGDPAGRIYSGGSVGRLYGVYCGVQYTDSVVVAQNHTSLMSCINACDMYNVIYFGQGSACRGVSFLRSGVGMNCILLGSSNSPVPAPGIDSAVLLNPQDPPPDNNYSMTTTSMTATATVTVTASANPSDTTLLTPACPGSHNMMYTSPNQDVWWIWCTSTPQLSNTGAASSAFRQCINLCSTTDGCSYAELNPQSSVCYRMTYACQKPTPGNWAAMLLATVNGPVKQPYCGGSGSGSGTGGGPGTAAVTTVVTISGQPVTITSIGDGNAPGTGPGNGPGTGPGTGPGLPTTIRETEAVTEISIITSVIITTATVISTQISTVTRVEYSTTVSTVTSVISGTTTTTTASVTVPTTVTQPTTLTQQTTVVESVTQTSTQMVTSLVTQTQPPVTITEHDGSGNGTVTVTVGGGSASSDTFTCYTTARQFLTQRRRRRGPQYLLVEEQIHEL